MELYLLPCMKQPCKYTRCFSRSQSSPVHFILYRRIDINSFYRSFFFLRAGQCQKQNQTYWNFFQIFAYFWKRSSSISCRASYHHTAISEWNAWNFSQIGYAITLITRQAITNWNRCFSWSTMGGSIEITNLSCGWAEIFIIKAWERSTSIIKWRIRYFLELSKHNESQEIILIKTRRSLRSR